MMTTLPDLSKPVRIQRRRVKGWRMPEGTVYVGRGSRYGNPFAYRESEVLVAAFKDLLLTGGKGVTLGVLNFPHAGPLQVGLSSWFARMSNDSKRAYILFLGGSVSNLRGKNLACWCPLVDKDGKPVPCHADVLLSIANS